MSLRLILTSKTDSKSYDIDKPLLLLGSGIDDDIPLEGDHSFQLLIENGHATLKNLGKRKKLSVGSYDKELTLPVLYQFDDLSLLIFKDDQSQTSSEFRFDKFPKDFSVKDYPERLLGFLFEELKIERGGLFKFQQGKLKSLAKKNLILKAKGEFFLEELLRRQEFKTIEEISFQTHTVLFEAGLEPSNFLLIRQQSHDQSEYLLYIPKQPNDKVAGETLLLFLYLCTNSLVAFESSQLREKYKRENLHFTGNYFWGFGQEMERVKAIAEKVAPTDLNLLIQGETGSGKEGLASYIAQISDRSLTCLNCAAIPKELAESMLFGHEKGAFTGAITKKEGVVSEAHGGVLFLDEIGELDLAIQAKLLRFLQDGTYTPVGSAKTKKSVVKIVAATHRDLHEMVTQEKFREDLFYRLNEVTLKLPPLRERKKDIFPLANHFLRELFKGDEEKTFTPSAKSELEAYPWPGNIRELRNTIRKIGVLYDGSEIRGGDIAPFLTRKAQASTNFPLNLADAKKKLTKLLVQKALKETEGHRGEAAKLLGINQRSLFRHLADDEIGSGNDINVSP